jgi:putative ABC transport system permease protein
VLGAINLSGLFAARARDRAKELSVRVALGARRRDLMALLLAEAALVAVIGSAIGLAAAQPTIAAARAVLPESLALLKVPEVDWRVAAFGGVAAVVPVIFFAFFPAIGALRQAAARHLSAATTSTPRVRSLGRGTLLVAESAIGIALVVTGALVLVSFVALRAEDSGFDRKGLLLIDIRRATPPAPHERQTQDAEMLARLRRIPGVSAAARMGVPLLEGMYAGSQFHPPNGGERFFASDVPVSGDFFDVAGLRLLDGRFPTTEELDSGRPVVAVSESTAEAYWPRGRALGQTLTTEKLSVTVVGTVEEARLGAQDERRRGEIYVPSALSRRAWPLYLVRTASDPDLVARDIALVLKRDVPDVLVRRAETFDAALSRSMRVHRFRTILFGVAAGAALLLLAVGVAGLAATGVSARRREIGIRTALGAARPSLRRMIVAEHLRPVALGVTLGLIASWWTTKLVSAFLYQIDPHEPWVWAGAAALLLLVAALATWIPARRASAVEPMVVLRSE